MRSSDPTQPEAWEREEVEPPLARARSSEHSGEPSGEHSDSPAAVPGTVAGPAKAMRRGAVPRADLDAVLDRGPGMFLRGIALKPRFLDRQFAGWEVTWTATDTPPFDRVDLRPGDVIASVNGRPIIRPQHLHAVWVDLRAATAIVVRVERAGQPFELHFEVIQDKRPTP